MFAEWVRLRVGWKCAGCCRLGRGCHREADSPSGEAAGFIFFLSFLLLLLGAQRRRQDKKLNRCQEGAAVT